MKQFVSPVPPIGHRGPTMAPLALRNAIAGLQWHCWHSGTPSRAYNGVAGTQERHRGPTMAPLALRNAVAGLQWRRWRSGTPSRAYNGALRARARSGVSCPCCISANKDRPRRRAGRARPTRYRSGCRSPGWNWRDRRRGDRFARRSRRGRPTG